MKNTKKSFKRFCAFLLTAIMLITSCIAVFASDTDNTPSASDKATITVTDVKSDAKVSAYRIVQPEYNDYGLTGYKLVQAVTDAGLTIADFESPTSNEVYAIAQAIAKNELVLEPIEMKNSKDNKSTFSAQVGAGEYIVIASGATEVIYNPMLLSVYYSVNGSDNTMASGSVSANDDWKLEGTNAKAKSSEPSVSKTITSPADGHGTNGQGSDAAIGDSIGYKIQATIPSYSAEYKEVEYIISDTLSTGLKPPSSNSVLVDGVAPSTDKATVTVDGQTITITFASDYILAHGGETITVTYSAVLNNSAVVNMDANTNTAKIQYTNDPSDKTKHTEKDDKTYTYTFALDGNVNGSQATLNKKTHEIIKVNEQGESSEQKFDETTGESTVTNALDGAEFTLTKKDDPSKIYKAVTSENGYFVADIDKGFSGFSGLDAGTYTLVETKAPDGYSLDAQKHTVEILAAYNEDGTLKSYTITIDGEATSTYTATYNADKTIIKIDERSTTTYIKNTKLGELPSTGGIGTYLFTVIGVALMVIAVALYLRKRRQA